MRITSALDAKRRCTEFGLHVGYPLASNRRTLGALWHRSGTGGMVASPASFERVLRDPGAAVLGCRLSSYIVQSGAHLVRCATW